MRAAQEGPYGRGQLFSFDMCLGNVDGRRVVGLAEEWLHHPLCLCVGEHGEVVRRDVEEQSQRLETLLLWQRDRGTVWEMCVLGGQLLLGENVVNTEFRAVGHKGNRRNGCTSLA